MLSDLFEIKQSVLQLLDRSCHTTQRRSLQLFALKQGLTELEQTDVISGNLFDKGLGLRKGAEGDFIMVLLVQSVHQVSVEWMQIVDVWKLLQDFVALFDKPFCSELHLTHVESSDTLDLEPHSDDGWGFSLGPVQDNVKHVI